MVRVKLTPKRAVQKKERARRLGLARHTKYRQRKRDEDLAGFRAASAAVSRVSVVLILNHLSLHISYDNVLIYFYKCISA